MTFPRSTISLALTLTLIGVPWLAGTAQALLVTCKEGGDVGVVCRVQSWCVGELVFSEAHPYNTLVACRCEFIPRSIAKEVAQDPTQEMILCLDN